MARIAYLISAFKDAAHLARLVSALDDRADFYVHVDLKSDMQPFREALSGKVTFVRRHWVSWGGWAQVEFQREMLGAVMRSGIPYTHVVCLSGQDYPLWSSADIHRYFDRHPQEECIMGMNLARCGCLQQQRKVTCYHFFRNVQWRNLWLKNKLVAASRKLMELLPFRKPPYTFIKGRRAEAYFGSDYWALTLPCARFVYETLCAEKSLGRYFRTSFAPSELCIHTIVFNSPFAAHARLYEGAYKGLRDLTPLHYIVYGEEIKVMTLDDLPALRRSGKMFCRKVVSGASDTLVEALKENPVKPVM